MVILYIITCITLYFYLVCWHMVVSRCVLYSVACCIICLAYIRGGSIRPTYMRRSDVSVSLGSGRYRLVSEPRLSDLKVQPSGKF